MCHGGYGIRRGSICLEKIHEVAVLKIHEVLLLRSFICFLTIHEMVASWFQRPCTQFYLMGRLPIVASLRIYCLLFPFLVSLSIRFVFVHLLCFRSVASSRTGSVEKKPETETEELFLSSLNGLWDPIGPQRTLEAYKASGPMVPRKC